MSLFEKLKRGETIQVYAARTGKRFSIRPVRWGGIVLAYTVLINGKPDPKFTGKMLDDSTVKDWCAHLVEVDC